MAVAARLMPKERDLLHIQLGLAGLVFAQPQRAREVFRRFSIEEGAPMRRMGKVPRERVMALCTAAGIGQEHRWNALQGEIDQWERRVTSTSSDSTRVQFGNDVHAVLKGYAPEPVPSESERQALATMATLAELQNKPQLDENERKALADARRNQEAALGVLEKVQHGRERGLPLLFGLAARKDALDRLHTAATIALLPEEVKLPIDEATAIVHHEDPRGQVAKALTPRLEAILPGLKGNQIHRDIAAGLKPEYLSNLFLYAGNYEKNAAVQKMFQDINQAYLVGGVEAAKKVKYDSPAANEVYEHGAIPKKVSEFIRGLDERIGTMRSEGPVEKIDDLHQLYAGKLDEHVNVHVPADRPDDAAAAVTKMQAEMPRHRKTVESILDGMPKTHAEISAQVRAFIKQNQVPAAIHVLREARSQGECPASLRRQIDSMMAPLNRMRQIAELPQAHELEKAVQVGQDVVRVFQGLQGKSLEEQHGLLDEARRRFDESERNEHARLLARMPKDAFRDYSYFIDELQRAGNPADEEEAVETRVTHDPSEHFTVGRFEKNCQSPGNNQYNLGLTSYSADPHELVFGHYQPGDDEHSQSDMNGFTFAHVIHHPDGRFGIAIERPYSNHAALKPKMKQHLDAVIEAINRDARRLGIPLEAGHANTFKGKGFRVIRGHAPKYYDMAGGLVNGGEEL